MFNTEYFWSPGDSAPSYLKGGGVWTVVGWLRRRCAGRRADRRLLGRPAGPWPAGDWSAVAGVASLAPRAGGVTCPGSASAAARAGRAEWC